MKDQKMQHLVDQLQTAVREIFEERGYDVDVSLSVGDDNGMAFSMDPKGNNSITEEIVVSVTNEAIERIGGKMREVDSDETY